MTEASLNAPRPNGRLRRRILLEAGPGICVAAVEDDFHCFRVTVRHSGGRVVTLRGEAIRYPWTSCPGATGRLAALEGIALDPGLMRRKASVDPSLQCTHLYELAVVGIAQAARHAAGGLAVRRYDVTVEDRHDRTRFPSVGPDGTLVRPEGGTDGWLRATLHRDDVPVLDWRIDGLMVTSPLEMAGTDYRRTGQWADQHGDDDLVEAVKVLRQGVHVAGGRVVPFGHVASAAHHGVGPICHTFQPEQSATAFHTDRTIRDFSDRPDLLLAALPPSVPEMSSGTEDHASR